jgi:hypothetical protein
MLNIKKFYYFVLTLNLAGYFWLIFKYYNLFNTDNFGCVFKIVTGIPCPSCDSTKGVISLLKFEILESLNYNPLSIIIFLIMLISPFWIITDLVRTSNSFYNFYKKFENIISKPRYSIPLIIIVLAIWIWNIIKHY